VVDVFLLRHSHVDYASPKGIAPCAPLTPLGCRMATRLAERCSGWGLEYLFVSTLLRAEQTADAITARLPDLPRVSMSELNEMSLSDLEGYPRDLPSDDLGTWKEEHFLYCLARMRSRVATGWEKVHRLVSESGLDRVAILAHGGTLNVLLRQFQGCDQCTFDGCWFEFDWTAVTCVRYVDGDGPPRKRVLWVNDAHHIDDLRHLLPS